MHGDAVLPSTNSTTDMNKGGVDTYYEGNVSALSAALDKVKKDLALEEERRLIAEDQLKSCKEEFAKLRDQVEDLLEEDNSTIPNKITIVAWTRSQHNECKNYGLKPMQSLMRSLLKRKPRPI